LIWYINIAGTIKWLRERAKNRVGECYNIREQ
jgi:hypothetical protein